MNYILEIFRKPMMEKTLTDEIVGCAIIFAAIASIWFVGQAVYQWENRRKK